jgi:hypothetical protein
MLVRHRGRMAYEASERAIGRAQVALVGGIMVVMSVIGVTSPDIGNS